VFALGAAIGLAACGPTSTNNDAATGGDVVNDEGGAMALYGGPPDVVVPTDAVDDDGSVMALYGLPADAGTPG
jgi:hypothetical protein